MKPLPALFAAAFVFAAGPALAEPATTPTEPAAAAPSADATVPSAPAPAEKQICKTKVKTGSMFPERTCMTKAQWDELNAKARDITNNAQLRGYRANSGG